jgi:hypothetical protein
MLKRPNVTHGPLEVASGPSTTDDSIAVYEVFYTTEGEKYGGAVCEVFPTGSYEDDRAFATAIAALPDLLTSVEDLWSDLGKAGKELARAGLDEAVFTILAGVRKSAQRMQAALLKAGYTEEETPC